MKVLITGSRGFIGSAITRRLREKSRAIRPRHDSAATDSGGNLCQIIALDRLNKTEEEEDLYKYRVDIADRKELFFALEEIKARFGERLDYVFHLAAYYNFSNKNSRLHREVNEGGTRNLLEALASGGFDVGALIFTSSTAVMQGLKDPGLIREPSPSGSPLYYGRSKLLAEEIIAHYKNRLKTVVVRLAGVYSQQCRLIPLAHQIASIYKGDIGSRFLPGGGHGCISYVHIEDVLDGFERIMTLSHEIPSGSVYILSEEDYLSYRELYQLVSQGLYRSSLGMFSLPKWLLLGGIHTTNYLYSLRGREYFFKPWMVDFSLLRYCFDTEKARKELGWRPRYSLRNYLGEILKVLEEDPKRWLEINNIHL